MTLLNRKNRKLDLIAVVCGLLLLVLYLLFERYGVKHIDESFYTFAAQSYHKGLRPFLDTWASAQLSCLFLTPLYSLFRFITGGTEGIILFMRQAFAVFNVVFFFVFYRYLRKFGIWGILTAAVVCAYVPWAIFALNYYTVPVRLLMLICCILFYNDHAPGKTELFFAGVLLSLSVIFQPTLAFLYFLYCVVVLFHAVSKKKTSASSAEFLPIFQGKSWLMITAAVAVCAVSFLTYLQIKSGLVNIFRNLPYFFSDTSYEVSFVSIFKDNLLSKFSRYVQTAGVMNAVSMSMLILLAIFCVVMNRLNRFHRRVKNAVLALACILSFLCYLCPILSNLHEGRNGWNVYYFGTAVPAPLIVFSLINHLLCEQRNKNNLVVWAIGLLSSILTDSISNASFCICGILCAVPCFLCFGQVLQEYTGFERANRKALQQKLNPNKHRSMMEAKNQMRINRFLIWLSKGAIVLIVLCLCVDFAFQGISGYYTETQDKHISALEKIDVGPFKGLYTSSSLVNTYNEIIDDLDVIKGTVNGPVYFYNCIPYVFLYLDLPSANCWNSMNSLKRQLEFFSLHPNKQPAVLCFNLFHLYSDERISETKEALLKEFASLLCEGETIVGKRGFYVKVNEWKDPIRPEILTWVEAHQAELT